ncbi:MAG: 3-dehydroquinate synthase [Conexibacter sp.]|nr:3-dehydroquinate synthase [Conexibacter sp.]
MPSTSGAPTPAATLENHDAIELPSAGTVTVIASSARADTYPIHITRTLEEAAARVRELVGGAQVAVVTETTVVRLHGDALLAALGQEGLAPEVRVVEAGEANKSLDQATGLWHWLAAGTLGRHDVLLTFGGGVVNDLGGWAAAGYMRGMRYVNVPTTLVGQVDAAIGGKLAVNHERAKNLIGGFHQPLGVVSNIAFLDTLDVRHVRAGLAEAIKKAIIASPAYWRRIETDAEAIVARDHDALERLVLAASAIKAELIARDPYEYDARRTLGFGHALAHPVETVTGYGPVLHGEAVAFGMVVEARMANARGLLPDAELERIVRLLRRVGLPTAAVDLGAAVDGERLLAATEKVRLARGGSLRWVLPVGIGETVIADDVTEAELRDALERSGIGVAGPTGA